MSETAMSEKPMTQTEVQFSDTEIQDELNYRPISWMGIGSLIVGLFSPVAIFSTSLWIWPIFASVLCLIALYMIRKNPIPLTGESLPIIGLTISLAVLGFAPIRQATRDRVLYGNAQKFADQFFETLSAGRFREAFLMHHPIHRRPDLLEQLNSSPKIVERNDASMAMMEMETGVHTEETRFFEFELIREFKNRPPSERPKVEFVSNQRVTFRPPDEDTVWVRYRATMPTRGGGTVELEFDVELIRGYGEKTRTGSWRMNDIRGTTGG